jgi:hypothetical protein
MQAAVGLLCLSFSEHFSRSSNAVQSRREASVNDHLLNRFDDFLTCSANIERSANVNLELGLSSTKRGEKGDGCEFLGTAVEPRPRNDIPVGKRDDKPTEVGSDLPSSSRRQLQSRRLLAQARANRARSVAHRLRPSHS